LPSDANFVLLPHPEAASIGAHLRRGGVLVRVLSRLPISIRALANANGNALRIGVAPWSIMRQTLDLLAAAIA
jgi:histidinol-phosphate/aromatic aminotransferase/cobyric acid decarboxylase-like protein